LNIIHRHQVEVGVPRQSIALTGDRLFSRYTRGIRALLRPTSLKFMSPFLTLLLAVFNTTDYNKLEYTPCFRLLFPLLWTWLTKI